MQLATNALADFIVRDVAPLMSSNVRKGAAIFTATALRIKPTQTLGRYLSFLQMIGVVNDDGSMVDVDLIDSALTQTFSEVPVITLFGIDFDTAGAKLLIERLRSV